MKANEIDLTETETTWVLTVPKDMTKRYGSLIDELKRKNGSIFATIHWSSKDVQPWYEGGDRVMFSFPAADREVVE